MSRTKQVWRLAVLILGVGLIFSSTRAQDPQEPQEPQQQDTGAKPKAAARAIPAIGEPDDTVDNAQAPTNNWQADTLPATGFQAPTLGSPELAHSYWIPGIQYGSIIQSNPPGQHVPSFWYVTNYVGGNVSLLEVWSHSQLAVNYSGGGYFTTGAPQGTTQQLGIQDNGGFQNLSLAQSIVLNRWQIQLFDYFPGLPGSPFGFGGGTNLALPGVGGSMGAPVPGLRASVTPDQSIYSAIGPRYSNTFASQITYSLSRRSSITIGGSYGILRFTESGNVDNDVAFGSVGFNYLLSREDSIGISYLFSALHFAGEPQAYGGHTVNFVYTKKIAQQLGLSLAGGPQVRTFRIPIGSNSSSVGLSANASLTYSRGRGSMSISYIHGLEGGSGTLIGSIEDAVTFTGNRQLSRLWNGNVNFGYARNGSVASANGIQPPSFNDWFVGGGIERPFGRNINFSIAYSTLFERANQAACTGPGCNTDYTQNVVSVSLQWHTRPFVLR